MQTTSDISVNPPSIISRTLLGYIPFNSPLMPRSRPIHLLKAGVPQCTISLDSCQEPPACCWDTNESVVSWLLSSTNYTGYLSSSGEECVILLQTNQCIVCLEMHLFSISQKLMHSNNLSIQMHFLGSFSNVLSILTFWHFALSLIKLCIMKNLDRAELQFNLWNALHL